MWTVHWIILHLLRSVVIVSCFWATPISQPLSHCHVGLTTSMDPSDYPHWWYPKAYFKNMLPWNPKRSMREGTILHPIQSLYNIHKGLKKGNIIEVGNTWNIKKSKDQNVAHLLTHLRSKLRAICSRCASFPTKCTGCFFLRKKRADLFADIFITQKLDRGHFTFTIDKVSCLVLI